MAGQRPSKLCVKKANFSLLLSVEKSLPKKGYLTTFDHEDNNHPQMSTRQFPFYNLQSLQLCILAGASSLEVSACLDSRFFGIIWVFELGIEGCKIKTDYQSFQMQAGQKLQLKKMHQKSVESKKAHFHDLSKKMSLFNP